MLLTVEPKVTEQTAQFLYSFQNEHGVTWEAKIENSKLSINKQSDDFQEIQLTLADVVAELDGTFDGAYDFEESCSLRTCEFTRAESYWILSVLLSAGKIMKH